MGNEMCVSQANLELSSINKASDPKGVLLKDYRELLMERVVIDASGNVPATGRAPKYMRALAIWAVYAALKNNKMPFNLYDNKIPEPADTFPLPFGKVK